MALSLRRRPSRFSASRRGLRSLTQPQAVSPNVLPLPASPAAPVAGTTGQVPSIAQPFNRPAPSTLTQGTHGNPPQPGWKFVGNYQNPGGDRSEIWLDPATELNHMWSPTHGVDIIPPYRGHMGNAGTTAPVQAPPGPGLPGYVDPNAAATGNGVTRVTGGVDYTLTAPPPGPAPAAGWGGQNIAGNPYAGTNMNYGGSPTVADKAVINGVEVWAGGPYAGRPVAESPADAGDLTPYLKDPTRADPTGRVQPIVLKKVE